MNIPRELRSHDAALLLSSALNEENTVRMALALYALYRVLNYLRFDSSANVTFDAPKALYLWAKRGADNSRAASLLRF